jgi:hypothetical protein
MMTIVAALLVGALFGYALGAYFGGRSARRSSDEVRRQYETLRRDFQRVSSANIHLMARKTPPFAVGGAQERERFLELYDEAKRCLHRALDRHNARADKPIVIRRDGSNLREALLELPDGSFGAHQEGVGLRGWLGQVFELDVWRRAAHAEPNPNALTAIEQEREVWAAAIKQHLK